MARNTWIDKHGRNYTSREVAAILRRTAGATYTARTLDRAYRVGAVYANGGLWFQRMA